MPKVKRDYSDPRKTICPNCKNFFIYCSDDWGCELDPEMELDGIVECDCFEPEKPEVVERKFKMAKLRDMWVGVEA